MHPKVIAMARAAMAAPDENVPFAHNPTASLMSAETLGNMTDIVMQAHEHLTPANPDIEAVYLAACYHYARARHVADDAHGIETRAAISLFSLVHAVRPDVVPQSLRTQFADNPPDLTPPAEILHAVALALFNDAAHRSDANGIQKAAGMIAIALHAGPTPHAESAMKYNLGSTQLELHRVTGQHEPFENGMKLMQQALRERTARYLDTGPRDPAELDAIISDTRVVGIQAEGHHRMIVGANLAILLRMRFELSGELDDIDRSIDLLTEIAPVVDDPSIHSSLALAYLHRHVANLDPADLTLATHAARASHAGADPHADSYPKILINLAAVLQARFTNSGDRADLAEAIQHLELATELSPDGNDHEVMRIKLATALTTRGTPDDLARADNLLRSVRGVNRQLAEWELAGATADDRLAVALYRETALVPTHDFRTRLTAAYFWGLRSVGLGDITDATRAFDVALTELLPNFAWLGLARRSTETRLREIPSLACNAAWAEIRAGRPQTALVRLEQGRGVLLSQALHLRFERALDWPQLRVAADHGPVVVINIADLGCDVLLISDDIQVIPLPGVTGAEVSQRAAQFLDAVAGMSTRIDFAVRLEHDQTMMDTLAWLWDHITGPVLAALGIEKRADPPRIWWCPTGDLALLPLHAAHHRATDTYVHDLVVSSYTPTLNTLIAARTASHTTKPTTIAVGMTTELPAVPEELTALAESTTTITELRDTAATPEAVLAALRTHNRAHLACHGIHNPDDPSGSGLRLHGGLLTVRDLAEQQLPAAEFAFLAACHTAAGGHTLVDEVITLASALQMCGYQQVIGGLWTVEDEIMPTLVRDVYQRIPVSGEAHALHEATRRLRAVPRYASPLFWASLAHIGV